MGLADAVFDHAGLVAGGRGARADAVETPAREGARYTFIISSVIYEGTACLGDPKGGRAGIEDNVDGLRRSADLDWGDRMSCLFTVVSGGINEDGANLRSIR